jgi:hypothetical protein
VKNNRLLKLVNLTAASLALAAIATGCQGGISLTTVSISNATMCRSIDPQTMEPIDKTNVFMSDTPEIFCSVKLSNAPDSTEVKAEWTYVQGEAVGTANYFIDSATMTAGGTRYLAFSVSKPDTGWPRGDYKVVFFVDGKERLTQTFQVQ